MAEPFLAEIMIVGFPFAPRGWSFCDGQILPINQNQSLYSLLGTTYGGDGRTTFALPDLRGRTPIGPGNSETSRSTAHTQGQKSGQETHTLTTAEVPSHTHQARASTAEADAPIPNDHVLAESAGQPYRDYEAATSVDLVGGSISGVGGGVGHQNMQPWLALNFCIALRGVFPSRN